MKKLVSLMLALVLCVCTLTPVMAEGLGSSLLAQFTTTATFDYTLADYQTMFNMLCSGTLSVTPVWTVEGTDNVATIEGYGEVIVTVNADGAVTKLSTSKVCTADDISNSANALGMLVAVTALSSKATEDISFVTEENINAYTEELLNLLYSLMDKITDAMDNTVSVTGELGGDKATFTMHIDMNTMAITFGFIYEP